MPLGDDIYRVVARTETPTFLDYHHNRGGDYTPEIGERGFMYETEAYAARTASDVFVLWEKTPRSLEISTPRKGTVTPIIPGDGAATHIAAFQPCVYDAAYNVTVTMAIDGGGDLTATIATTEGGTSAAAAILMAGSTVAGVTIIREFEAIDVYFTPDSGAFTKFEITVTDVVVVAASVTLPKKTRYAPASTLIEDKE